jgi:putative ABC transport system substrate-binding protein
MNPRCDNPWFKLNHFTERRKFMFSRHSTPRKSLMRWTVVSLITAAALFLSGCAGAAKPKTYTIGVILYAPTLELTFTGFKQGMTDLGYIEGENVTYIYAGPTDSIDKLDGVVQDLVKAKVDLILSISTPATLAAKKATAGTNIPVVFVPLTDPVGAGVVASLTQPGGNITGITFGLQEVRRLEWLKKIAPNVNRVYVIYNPDDSSANLALKTVNATAPGLGLEIITQEAKTPDDVATALANLPENVDAIYLLPDSQTESKWTDILAVANAHNLPTSVANVNRVKDGALFTYAMKLDLGGKQAAGLADQILKGVQPADLPVEMTEFFLAINLKEAQAIGFTIPEDILSQADTIIR